MNRVIGHEENINMLKRAFAEDKLAHAYLFFGIKGVGKRTTAKALAKFILCGRAKEEKFCGCPDCVQVEKEVHPDLRIVHGSGTIKIKQVHQLQKDIQRSPCRGLMKVIIIEECDIMTIEAANALLKVLEEPIGRVVFILTSSRFYAIKPTIVSRCQCLLFSPLKSYQIAEGISRYSKKELTKEYQHVVISMACGSLGRALELLDDEFERIRLESLEFLKNLQDDLSITKLIMHSFELSQDKEVLKNKIEIFWLWFRDLLIWKIMSDEKLIVNLDVLEDVKIFAGRYSKDVLKNIINNISVVLNKIENRANARLALDAFFLDMYRDLTLSYGRTDVR